MNHLIKIPLLATVLLATLPFVSAATAGGGAGPTAANAPAAQSHPRHAHALRRRRAIRHRIAKRLHLSTDQRSQIKAIRGSTRHALAALRANASLTPEQKRTQAHALRAAARQQMGAVLTPAQKTRLEQMRARLRERLGGF